VRRPGRGPAVEAGYAERARQHGRRTAGQVRDGHHAGDAFGPAEQEPGQRVRVQLVPEVRVIGHGEQVGAEQDIVIGHQPSFRRRPPRSAPSVLTTDLPVLVAATDVPECRLVKA